MDEGRLAEIRGREKAATEGPWKMHELHLAVNDLTFISHARQDIPDLLADLDAARAEAARLRRYEALGQSWSVDSAGMMRSSFYREAMRALIAEDKARAALAGEPAPGGE